MKKRLYIGLILLLDVAIIGFSFLLLAYHRTGTRVIIRNYARPLFGFIGIWTLISLITNKYHLRLKKDWSELMFSIFKSNFISFSIVLMLFFFLKMFFYSRYIVFGTIISATIIEIILFIAIYYTFKFRETNRSYSTSVLVTKSPILDTQQAGKFFVREAEECEAEKGIYAPDFDDFCAGSASILRNRYYNSNPKMFEFVNETIDLEKFSSSHTLILNSATYFNIEYIDEASQHLFINLHRINDLRRINRYFIKVNQNLHNEGVFVCCGETIKQRYRRFINRSGRLLGNIFYAFDFFFRRVCPKVLFLQGLYFFLTQGRDRSLSETEILGRLFFCGFDVVSYKEIDGTMYFVIKKIKEPCEDDNPSYGPLIRLKRVGKEGRMFNVYKIRTMHPYSEYLQEYVFKRCRIAESGKFAGDFRISSWGKIMRNYWIDELPQLFNLLKGDLNLIGTRALSRHYFEQYPEDLKELRLKYKPGLIPVYTADKAKTLVELIASERAYLLKKGDKGKFVDFVYLSKAVFNILTRQAKSLDTYS